jgi:hypothetical protein
MKNRDLLDNIGYTRHEIRQLVLQSFDEGEKTLTTKILDKFSSLLIDEYISEYEGKSSRT